MKSRHRCLNPFLPFPLFEKIKLLSLEYLFHCSLTSSLYPFLSFLISYSLYCLTSSTLPLRISSLLSLSVTLLETIPPIKLSFFFLSSFTVKVQRVFSSCLFLRAFSPFLQFHFIYSGDSLVDRYTTHARL